MDIKMWIKFTKLDKAEGASFDLKAIKNSSVLFLIRVTLNTCEERIVDHFHCLIRTGLIVFSGSADLIIGWWSILTVSSRIE